MKYIKLFIVIILITFLPSCSQNEITNIYTFSSRFNSYSKNYQIDKKSLCAEHSESTYIFPLCFEDKILLTVRTNDNSLTIKECSVTYLKNKNSKNDYEDLKEIILCTVRAIRKTDEKTAENILNKSGITDKKILEKDSKISFTKDFYSYETVADSMGIYFSVKNTRSQAE